MHLRHIVIALVCLLAASTAGFAQTGSESGDTPEWQAEIVPRGEQRSGTSLPASAGAAKALRDGRLQPTQGEGAPESETGADVTPATTTTPTVAPTPSPTTGDATTVQVAPTQPANQAQPAATQQPGTTQVAPAQVQPVQVQPAQVQPTPVQPTQVQPAPVQPTQPGQQAPAQVTPQQPGQAPATAPVAPATQQPVVDPNQVQPAPAAGQPTVAPGQPTAPAQPAAAAPAPAPEAPPLLPLPEEVEETIAKSTATMDKASKKLADISAVDGELGRLRDEVDEVISSTTRAADLLRPRLQEIKSEINKLGPPPKEGEPAEGETAANVRARLNAEQSQVSGAIKTLEVTWFRARKAIEKITEVRLQLFVRSLTERMTKPFLTDLGERVAKDWPSVEWRIRYNINDWSSAIGKQAGSVTLLAGAAGLLYFLLKSISLWIVRVRSRSEGDLTFFQRAFAASWTAPLRALPGVATALMIYFGLDYLGLLYYPTSSPAGWSLLKSSLIFIGVSALLTSVFSPNQPERRLVGLSNRSARRISRLLKTLTLIYAADLFMSAMGQVLYFPLSISILQSVVASLAFAAVLIGLLLTPFAPHDEVQAGEISRFHPTWIKAPLGLAALAILVVCLAGYVSLGRFLSQQIVMTGVIGLIGTLLYLAIRAFTRENNGHRTVVSRFLEERFGFDFARRRQLASIVEFLLTVIVGLLLAPLVLLQWGFAEADIRNLFSRLFFGFEVGTIQISLFRIFVGIAIFTGLLFVTRLFQRRLRTTVLNRPKLDPGIANSVDKAVGYAGILIATLVAVSYAGFDVTNLAIVAGALGVGIGFGLQSIVNNFVSGLILLIERPIKVGDWIVVGDQQGIVKNISVRSTEIETFARASLIIPNSELIAGRVLNMTHRNALGRIDLFFNTGLDEDPNRVIVIMQKIADDHPDILREPAPIALFEGYTATATEYSLRFYLPDIGKGLKIRSDIRVSVYKAFRDAGIEMPVTTTVKGGVARSPGIE